MVVNEKYKLLGFDSVHDKINLMVLNTGRVLSVPYNEIRNSDVMDDLTTREIEAIYRKIYSSGIKVETEYDFSERYDGQWIFYAICCLIISVCYIYSNVAAVKPVYIFSLGITVTPGTFVYPLTFLVVDLLNEFYGFRRARDAIFMCIVANAAILGMLTFSLTLPSLPGWKFNSDYTDLIRQIQSTFLASTISFMVSELVNSRVLCYIKKLTNSNYLCIRIFVSTFVASILDSFIFCFIVFLSLMPVGKIISMAIAQVVIKLLYSIFNIIPAYGARYLFNRYLVRK
jgi:queuosine precursor transporter